MQVLFKNQDNTQCLISHKEILYREIFNQNSNLQ